MVKYTDFAENVILRGTVTVIQDIANGNGDGCLEVENIIHGDTIRSNTDVLPVDLEQVEFKEKTMTMIENNDVIVTPDTDKSIFFINSGLLKSKDSNDILTTYQPTTTKGDLLTHNGTTQIRLPASINGYSLVVDSSTNSGLNWVPFTNSNPKFISNFSLVGKDSQNSCVIVDKIKGNYFNIITTLTEQGPLGASFVLKNKDESYGHIVNVANSPSIQTGKSLRSEYNPYREARVYKESTEGDGTYSKFGNTTFVKNDFNLSGTSYTTILPDTYGAFCLSITSDNSDFPLATFLIAKSNENDITGNILRLSSSPSTDLTELSIIWPALSGPRIKKSSINHDGTYQYIDNFELAVITSVNLSGTTPVEIDTDVFYHYEKKCVGVKITNQTSGYPVSVIYFSKNSKSNNGTFFSVLSPGSSTLEKIRISWPSESLIKVYKDGVNYDGIYDISLIF